MDPDLLQWPAMVITVVATWLVGSTRPRRRQWGFWLFMSSNVLWVAWGWHAGAPGLIVLQFCLAAMNIRGIKKAKTTAAPERSGDEGATAH